MIAYDNSVAGRCIDNTTVSFVCASNAVMYVAITNNVTAVTYNGVALTSEHSFTSPILDGNAYSTNILKLLTPSSGTHNLVFSVSSGAGGYSVITYTGARDIESWSDNYSHTDGPPPANTLVGSLSGTVTTLTNNAWTVIFGVGSNNRNMVSAGNTTHRASASGVDFTALGVLDSNGAITPSGSSTLTATWESGSGFTVVSIASLRPVSVPSAPTIGTASQVNGNLQVTFSDNDNGGSAITGHTATATPGGATATGSSPITFTGLNGGVSYTFKVKATNAIGDSAESSASNAVTLNTGMMAFF